MFPYLGGDAAEWPQDLWIIRTRFHQPGKGAHIAMHFGRAIRWMLHSVKLLRVGHSPRLQGLRDCRKMAN